MGKVPNLLAPVLSSRRASGSTSAGNAWATPGSGSATRSTAAVTSISRSCNRSCASLSANPSPEMTKPLANFVAERMRELGMDVRQRETAPNNVSNLGKLAGSDPAAARANGGIGSLLYYAHLDTVPAGDERNWCFPPFSATVAEDGRMYGRGGVRLQAGNGLGAGGGLWRCAMRASGSPATSASSRRATRRPAGISASLR